MGLYLFIIAYIDSQHSQWLSLNPQIWRHSFYCKAAAFVSSIAFQMSICSQTMLAIERWYGTNVSTVKLSKRSRKMITICSLCWLIWSALLISILAITFKSMPNETCLILNLINTFAAEKICVYSIMLTNTLACGLCVHLYIRIYVSAVASAKELQNLDNGLMKKSFSKSQASLKSKLLVLVIPNIICHFLLLNILLLSGHTTIIHAKLSTWIQVLLMLAHAILNPFLYTINKVILKAKKAN